MNDRSVSLLDNYDIEVLRTWKGRGAILCETNQGILILKEYAGNKEKVVFQDALLAMIREKGFINAESIIKNKEQELLTWDQDGSGYILKTYFGGRECNVRDMEECRYAVAALAKLHLASRLTKALPGAIMSHGAQWEFEKHNRELKRVKKYLRDRSQKTDFEIYLLGVYDYFLNLALQITEELPVVQEGIEGGFVCHGDYQYHNLLLSDQEINIVNFEKCIPDSPARDLYLFLRKLLEKNGWVAETGFDLIMAYEKIRPMEKEEYRQLYYRLAYPEKFWKIVNFYINSGKAWIPGKNLEKLQKVAQQEDDKKAFLEKFKVRYGL